MRGFLSYCEKNQVPLDFISRHHYTTHQPEMSGHYGYANLQSSEYAFSTLKRCREIIGEFKEYENLPFYITEFNTAYIPNCPLHDTNQNAASLARILSEIGDYCTGYSYWTFGDVFEEQGVPFTPFYGGFGLLANNGIPKPTFWTFEFFKHLTGKCLLRNEHAVVCENEGIIRGVLWNLTCETNSSSLSLQFNFPLSPGEYCCIRKIVDETTCNPQKVWHDIGEPANLSEEQTDFLREAANPSIGTERKTVSKSPLAIDFSLSQNAVIYFEIFPSKLTSDRGFLFDREALVTE